MRHSTRRLFTSESVTEGHPDKLCDRLSDCVLDAILEKDPQARVAVETLATTGMVHVAGEVTTSAYVEIPQIVRQEINRIGYTSSDIGFDGNSCGVAVSIGQQSTDIGDSITRSLESRLKADLPNNPRDYQGAGDQGLMFGYACTDTPSFMPAPIWLAHQMAERLAQIRHLSIVEGLLPDGKTQVTLEYEGNTPVAVNTVVVSTQHREDMTLANLTEAIRTEVVDHVLKQTELDQDNVRVLINPSGRFVLGGPAADAGLTGRKIIVDTYGGTARHGGGAFSGKDPSKVDRSGAYAMRWVAKNIVAAGLATRCEIQIAYAIGSAQPVGLWVETFGTGQVPDTRIAQAVTEVFDLRPLGIIEELDLLRPIYAQTSVYGHFGREGFTWENTNRVAELKQACSG